jgi:hypothetical protein
MFGIGVPEIILLAVVTFVFFGARAFPMAGQRWRGRDQGDSTAHRWSRFDWILAVSLAAVTVATVVLLLSRR